MGLNSERLSADLFSRLFPEGSLDATRMIQRCEKNGIRDIAAARTILLRLENPSPFLVWAGLAYLDRSGNIFPDKSGEGIEELKEDFLRWTNWRGRAGELEWMPLGLLADLGLTAGKISPLDFIGKNLAGFDGGLMVVSSQLRDFLVSANRRINPPVLLPKGANGVTALHLQQLVFKDLGKELDSGFWKIVI